MTDVNKELESLTLAGQGKVAVVIGGTLGMGAASARLLAKKGCSKVIVVGRNVQRGEEMAQLLGKLGGEGVTGHFVQSDLGTMKGMKATARDIEREVADNKIDYLFLTQNGFMTGTHVENEDGDDPDFAIQGLSRFALIYYLITSGSLKKGATVLSICNVGQTLATLEVNDLSLKKMDAGRTRLFLAQSARDSCVIDASFLEFIERYPEYRFLHMFPGMVKTENWSQAPSVTPFPVNFVFWAATPFIPLPDKFIPTPVWLAIAPDAATKAPGHFFGPKLKVMQPGAWAQDKKNRKELWDFLVAKFS